MAEGLVLTRGKVLDHVVEVPGDKSLTHRALLLGALADGTARVERPLDAEDTRTSARVAAAWGAEVVWPPQGPLTITGHGRRGLLEPPDVLDCGNSGTTMRLAIGIASGIDGALTVLTGDASLRGRPMRRVVDPLAQLGGTAWVRAAGTPPVVVRGGGVSGGVVSTPVASAQVKSALLLAGVLGRGPVTVREPLATRDHTERLLKAMGVRIERDGLETRVWPGDLSPLSYRVPGDPSSAANWWVMAAISGGRVTTPGVLLNPSRIGVLEVLRTAGAAVSIELATVEPEPVGTVTVSAEPGRLRRFAIGPEQVPALVDEVPLLALLASCAQGTSQLRGLGELRVKETDRLALTARGLSALGARVRERADELEISGPTPIAGTHLDAAGDHRMALVWAVAAAVASSPIALTGTESVAVSYPSFWTELEASGAVRLSRLTA